jgi:hypothetical protein
MLRELAFRVARLLTSPSTLAGYLELAYEF